MIKLASYLVKRKYQIQGRVGLRLKFFLLTNVLNKEKKKTSFGFAFFQAGNYPENGDKAFILHLVISILYNVKSDI